MDDEKSLAVTVKILANQFHRFIIEKTNIVAKIKKMDVVTESQAHVIGYLYENLGKETIYQKDIEKQLSVRRSTVTAILQRMEKAGLITREVSGSDARMKALTLTEKAKKLYPLAKVEILKADMLARKGMSDEEVEQFFRIAEKISRNIS